MTLCGICGKEPAEGTRSLGDGVVQFFGAQCASAGLVYRPVSEVSILDVPDAPPSIPGGGQEVKRMTKFTKTTTTASGGNFPPWLNGEWLAKNSRVGATVSGEVGAVRYMPIDTVTPGKFGKVRRPVPGPPDGPPDQTIIVEVAVNGTTLTLPLNANNYQAIGQTLMRATVEEWVGASVSGVHLSNGAIRFLRMFPDAPCWVEVDRRVAEFADGQRSSAAPAPLTAVAPHPATPLPPAAAVVQPQAPAPQVAAEDILAKAQRMLAEATARMKATEERAQVKPQVKKKPSAKKK